MTQIRVVHPPEEASVRELLFLQRLSKAAASTIEPDALLELIINETTGAMQVEVCSLCLFGRTRRTSWSSPPPTASTARTSAARLVMKLGDSVTGSRLSLHLQALVVPDVTQEPRFQWLRGVDQKRLVAMLSVPILAGSRMIGVVNVQSEERRDFDKADIDFLGAIAGQVAGIIERSEMHRRLQAQLEEIRGSQAIHERFTSLALAGAGPSAILRGHRQPPRQPASSSSTRPGTTSSAPARRPGERSWASAASTSPPRSPPRALVSRWKWWRASRPRPLVLTPIRAGDELLGVLAADALPTEHPNRHRRALEHGATVLALELAKERAAAEVERRLRGDLVEELLSHGLERDKYQRLAAQAERLGYRVAIALLGDGGGARRGGGSGGAGVREHAGPAPPAGHWSAVARGASPSP